MADNKENEQLSNLKKLVQRNAGLDKQIGDLLEQYKSLASRDEQYAALLREYGLELEAQKERQGVRRFRMVSLIYLVVQGFQELVNSGEEQRQLDLLDELVISVSDIADKYGLVKVPTIGDNMLLCAGLKQENKTNPIDATCAAYEINQWMKEFKERTGAIWEIRMGIHTGPIIARYLSRKNVPYTVSGGNVLTVSRLAWTANANHIILSPMTYELIKEFFEAETYGRIAVRYSGIMDTYQLIGVRPELQGTEYRGIFNSQFDLCYSRVQFMDIQEYVLDMLEEKLPKTLYYHNVKHTIDVTTEVELIGYAEGLSEQDIMLLKVAGLFHDSGHIKTYNGHEEVSCEYADEILPQFNYPQEKIDTIKRIIMATKLPHQPADILEAVIQDSDLDYLGRSDFIPVSNMLYKEMTERGAKMTINEWNKIQIKFISSHQYYTNTAQSLREVNKQSQIERLKELVEECERNGEA